MRALFEQYRPAEFADVVGQDKALTLLSVLRRRGLSGRAYWISGQSGTGKTTLARLIAAEVADDWATVEIDGDKLNVGALEEFERAMRYAPLGRGTAWPDIRHGGERERDEQHARPKRLRIP